MVDGPKLPHKDEILKHLSRVPWWQSKNIWKVRTNEKLWNTIKTKFKPSILGADEEVAAINENKV